MSLISFLLIICLFLLIVLSAFLSGSETALTATTRARILLRLKKGEKKANFVLRILDNLDDVKKLPLTIQIKRYYQKLVKLGYKNEDTSSLIRLLK